jgi:hemolysin activation/secretion protein
MATSTFTSSNGRQLVKRSPTALRLAPLVLILAAAFAPLPALSQQLATAPPEATFTVTGFEISGENPIGNDKSQEVLKPYLGPQTDITRLEAARRALADAIHNSGVGLYRVVLPPQEVNGVVRLVIAKIPITAITVTGEKYFSEGNIRASVPALAVGETPNMTIVERDLEQANDNPDKHTTVKFAEDPNSNGITAELHADDKSPWSVTLGANNTGTGSQGGEARILGYLQYADLFGKDQTIGLAYTTSPEDPNEVKQYGIYYKAPIYTWGGFFSASHSYSSTQTGALGSGQVITGAGEISGIAYTQLLNPMGSYKSSAAIGLDDKVFRSPTLDGLGQIGGNVRDRPVSLSYVGNYDGNWGTMGWSGELDHNLTGGAYNNADAYTANRYKATQYWTALRLGYNVESPLWMGFALAVRLNGQYSWQPLIQGEEFGIGGASSVRGAPERAVIGDTGLSSSIEVYTPELGYNVRALVFTDSGFVIRKYPVVGEPDRDALQSVGVGLRWNYAQTAQFSLDWGYIVHGADYPSIPTGANRVSANLLYTFNAF